jgi:surfactin synthase thioesterase subunit
MDARTLRVIELIDALEEQYPDAPSAPREAFVHWSEDDVRAWYHTRGEAKPRRDEEGDDKTWFPGLERSGTRCVLGKTPKLRILCFPNAGNMEDMYTHEGTGARRATSPLLEFAKTHEAEVLAVQYPGRGNRSKESCAFEIDEIIHPLLPVVAGKLSECPYVVVGHSVGSWIAYEFLQLLRARGVRMPEHVFLSAFPYPDIPHDVRPWRINVLLDEEGFKDECRRWDVNELVFGDIWKIYQPLMRADFHLFDKYDHVHDGKENFTWPLTVFHGESDRMITREMCQGWETHTTGEFELLAIPGHHLFPLQKDQKAMWLRKIAERLQNVVARTAA